MMNSLDRINKTLKGLPKDRPPLSLTLSLYGARLTDCPLSAYYRNPEYYNAGQLAVMDEFHPDVIFGPFVLPYFGAAFGSQLRIFEDQAPNLKAPVVQSVEDIDRLDFDRALESANIQYMLESIRLLKIFPGDYAAIAAIALNPVDLPIMLMGISEWLDLVLTDLPTAMRLIEKTEKFFVKFVMAAQSNGASFIVMPAPFVNPAIVTYDIAIQFQSVLHETFSDLTIPLVLHSAGARIIPFLQMWATMPNVVGVVIDSKDDLLTSRELLPRNVVLLGNIEGPDLDVINSVEISARTEKILRDSQGDPKFIFASSGADIPYDTPLENIKLIADIVGAAA